MGNSCWIVIINLNNALALSFMNKKYEVALFATIFAIVFTVLSYIDIKRAAMWLSIEVIILPFLYVVGYEMLMDKQKKQLEEKMNKTLLNLNVLEKQNLELKHKLNTIKKIK